MHSNGVMVITGTSRGIGLEVAKYFLNKGFVVLGCSRGEGQISHLSYRHYRVDIRDEVAVRSWARKIKVEFGGVDILVCNVGLVQLGAVACTTSLSMFQDFINSILVSTFLVCREFSKMMIMQKKGRIINITSIMSELHAPGTSAYASAKKGVVEFTKVLANELVNYGVTCNVISPSLVSTESSSSFGKLWESNMLDMQTIKRPINPIELCPIIEFFISSEASILTGQVLYTCLVD